MKRFFSIILMACISVMLTSCMSHIEDINGDDTSLASIDLASKIESGSYSSRSSLSSTYYSGDSTYCFLDDDIDYDNMDITYGLISGVTKLQCSDMSQGETLTLTINSTLTEGNLEIVVVGPNNTIVETVAVNEIVTVTIPSTDEGEYFVVIGAESAKVSIEIDREID